MDLSINADHRPVTPLPDLEDMIMAGIDLVPASDPPAHAADVADLAALERLDADRRAIGLHLGTLARMFNEALNDEMPQGALGDASCHVEHSLTVFAARIADARRKMRSQWPASSDAGNLHEAIGEANQVGREMNGLAHMLAVSLAGSTDESHGASACRLVVDIMRTMATRLDSLEDAASNHWQAIYDRSQGAPS